jgi:hypothetical protein
MAINPNRQAAGRFPLKRRKFDPFDDIGQDFRPPYVRKTQAEWLAMARQALKV